MPIDADGEVVGAVGVSGASSADEDQELATIGARAIEAAIAEREAHDGNGALHVARAALEERFATGGLLSPTGATSSTPGAVTHRARSSSTSATSTSCTSCAGRPPWSPGARWSTRARWRPASCAPRRCEGGTPHALGEGDVLAIPAGVPHQFTEVSDPFLYFVVKVGA